MFDPLAEPAGTPSPIDPPTLLGKIHARRLREIYRSAGWPCQDLIEIELLASGMLQRVAGPAGHETLRVTDAGISYLAATLVRNRSALSAHGALIENGRLVVARAAPRRARQSLPLGVWMALAKATPVAGLNEDEQGMLGDTAPLCHSK